MQTETNALAQSAQWIAQLATGSIATGAATIAIAAVGFAMLAGRIDLRRGASVIIGCFILFAAPTMARSFLQWAGAGEADRTAAYELSSLPTTSSGPPVAQPFDPYAGASLIK
jgi:type IV secretory pathway VirB2 component (pilin)